MSLFSQIPCLVGGTYLSNKHTDKHVIANHRESIPANPLVQGAASSGPRPLLVCCLFCTQCFAGMWLCLLSLCCLCCCLALAVELSSGRRDGMACKARKMYHLSLCQRFAGPWTNGSLLKGYPLAKVFTVT